MAGQTSHKCVKGVKWLLMKKEEEGEGEVGQCKPQSQQHKDKAAPGLARGGGLGWGRPPKSSAVPVRSIKAGPGRRSGGEERSQSTDHLAADEVLVEVQKSPTSPPTFLFPSH